MRELELIPEILKENGQRFDLKEFKKELNLKQKEHLYTQEIIKELLKVKKLDFSNSKDVIKALYSNNIYPKDLTLEFLIKNKDKHEIYKLLLKEKNLRQFIYQYGDKLDTQICSDGRIRGHWKMDGSRTGRMTCSNPNLQAFPKITKKYFKPEEGYIYVIGDYGQIELRVLAELSKDINMTKAFEEGRDIHTETASAIFNKKVIEVTNVERAVGKKLNFALCYGVSAYGLKKIIKKEAKIEISLSQANKLISLFYDKYPKILCFHNKLLISDSISSLGGKVWNDIPKGDRSRYNLPIQATAAEGLKEALKLLILELNSKWKLVNVVHDEIVIEVPKQDAENAKLMLEKVMILGMSKLLKKIPIEVEVKVQENWDK